MDKEFLKKLTILYVEDDELIAKELSSTIEKLFKKIIVAKDGQDGLDKYNQNKDEINLIISDISMPVMNGIELLKSVRKEDLKIPFIFTTAFTDKEYLVDSLKQGVHDYFIKPINLNELLIKIEKVAKKVEHESVINNYQLMIKEYFDTINKVAVVFVFDLEGKLIFVNDFLKELGKYNDEDILGKDYRLLYHSDVSNDIVTKQFKELMLGSKWNGNLKFTTKDDSVFYTNTTILPLKEDGNINKFICVNFLTTKEENSRREFKKKVLYNFQETKKIFKKAQEKIDEIEQELQKYVGYEKKEEDLLSLRSENNKNLLKLQELEEKIKKIKKRQDLFTFEINSKIKQISEETLKMKDFTDKSGKKISKLKHEIKIREHFIEKVNKEIKEKNQKIIDLEDVLLHRDSQLDEEKPLNYCVLNDILVKDN
jgi:CheY-like chemotaxis protein